MPQDRLKSLLKELSYEKRDVTLASGRKSDFYFDGKQTSLHPEGATLLGKAILEKIRSQFSQAEAVGGPTLGADPLVTAVSVTSFQDGGRALPAFIIRKEPKKHGTQAWIEGFKNLKQGMKVVLLEDVVTTGGSVLTAVDRARESGLEVLGVVVIVDREEGGREALLARGVPLESLYTKTQLLS